MLYPIQELDKKRLQAIKDATKLKLLEKATKRWARPVGDYVIREAIFGDTTVPDVYDIQPHTAVAAGVPEWAFDAVPLTADRLSSVVKAGTEVTADAYIGIYGFYDCGVAGAEVTGAADTPVAYGAITSVAFARGSSTLEHWKTDHLYAYDEVVGITDRPVIYEENEKIDIKVCATEDTEDKYAGFRAYICEPFKRNITPTLASELRYMYGVSAISELPYETQKEVVIRGGIEPAQELTAEQVSRLYSKVTATLYQMVVDEGIYRTIAEAKANYVIREVQGGDRANAVDFVDFNQAAAVTAGEQEWIQKHTLLTAGTLKNVIASGEKVTDKKFVAIIGFADTTPNSCLLEIAPADSSGNLDLWHVQHAYAYHDMTRGYTMRPTYYKQNSPFVLKMCVRKARQHRVKPIMLIAEEYGNVISKT